MTTSLTLKRPTGDIKVEVSGSYDCDEAGNEWFEEVSAVDDDSNDIELTDAEEIQAQEELLRAINQLE